MKSLLYWLGFQILIGIWMFVSPFVLGNSELTGMALNNMIFGAIVVLLGFGVSFYMFYHSELYHRVPEAKQTN